MQSDEINSLSAAARIYVDSQRTTTSSQLDADLFDTFCTIPDAATPTPTAQPLPSSFLPMPAARTSTVAADSSQSLQLSPLSVFARAPYLTSAAASTTINPAQLHRDTAIDQDEALVISPTSTKSSPSPVWLTRAPSSNHQIVLPVEQATGETEPSHSANPAMDMPERSMSNSPDLDISDPGLVERPDPTRKGSGDTVKVYLCPECPRTFTSKHSWRLHLRTHAGPKLFKCPITSCGRTFSNLENGQRHLNRHGPEFGNMPLFRIVPHGHAPGAPRPIPSSSVVRTTKTVVLATSSGSSSTSSAPPSRVSANLAAAVASAQPPIPRPTNTHTHTHTIQQPASALPPAPASIQDLRPPASLLRPIPGAVTLPNRFPMLSPGPNTLSSPPCPLPPVRPTFMRFIVPLRPGPMPLPLPLGGAGAAARTGVALNAAGEQLFGVMMVGEERDSGVLAPVAPYHPVGWKTRPVLPGPATTAPEMWEPSLVVA